MAYYILKPYKLSFSPFKIFTALSRRKNCFFLDSSLNLDYRLGRYSFLGSDPFFTLSIKDERSLGQLRQALEKYRLTIAGNRIPFLGGAAGYLTYDLEGSFFGFYNSAVIIDHLKNTFYLFSCGFPEKKSRLAALLVRDNFRRLLKSVSGAREEKGRSGRPGKNNPLKISSTFRKSGYIKAVKLAKEYIRQGDIYQVNLSQEFRANTDLPAVEIYRRLRDLSPSYFGAYLDSGQTQILSSSPERFLKLDNGIVTTSPMKGTRARGKTKAQDAKLKKELWDSAKDKAELMMIVDLERNDLGRVCDYGSIKVRTLRQMEEYSTVFQATAEISGRLHPDRDRIDLIRACFPGGSITGCPKIRAIEIIKELEPQRRGIYTGSLGYFSFSGGMDFNILIRTIAKHGSRIYFGAGGGIVADSKAEAEYEETLVKAKAMMEAIR